MVLLLLLCVISVGVGGSGNILTMLGALHPCDEGMVHPLKTLPSPLVLLR